MVELIHQNMGSLIFWIVAPNVPVLVLIFIASLWERQWTQPFVAVPLREADGHSALGYDRGLPDGRVVPEYVKVMGDEAMGAGFEFGGLMALEKNRVCRGMGTVWMSGDRRTLILSWAGTVLGFGRFQTTLFSHSPEGRMLVTTDNEDVGDRSGLYRIKREISRPFAALLARHEERLKRYGKRVESFVEETAMESYFAIMERRTELMVAGGVARYVVEDGTRWRYTGWGALRNSGACLILMGMGLPQFFRGFLRPVGSHHLVELGETVWERYGKARMNASD